MTRPRFIAIVRPNHAETTDVVDAMRSRLLSQGLFRLAVDRGRLLVAASGPTIALGDEGVILGSLFRPGVATRLNALTENDRASIASSSGRHLIDAYWGPYVAILTSADASRISIMRAPLGELPCYRIDHRGTTILASDVDALESFGLFSRSVAWPAVSRYLAARDLRHHETCLEGLEELRGGCRHDFDSGGDTVTALWSPWRFAVRARQIDDPDEAARRLRDTTLSCVTKRASEFDTSLLMLSGGLDSSIVASCLASRACRFFGLNLVTTDPAGDERIFARQVAATLAAPLIERVRDAASIRIDHSSAARLPRPSTRAFLQESRRRADAAARAAGASVIFNGGGGDNVFGSVQSVAPAVDRLLTTGLDRRFWSTVTDISRMAPASLWTVATGALRRAWRPSPLARHPSDTRFLTPTGKADAAQSQIHPWLQAPAGVLPGAAAHVASIAYAQSYVESLDPQDDIPTVAPLLAQPLVELCLRIPSWRLLADGGNRAIARRAFASDLPAQIIGRTSKGRPDSFSAEIFERYRLEIRDFLLGGALVAHDLIDRTALAPILEDPGPLRGDDFHRLLDFVDVEAWVRSQC